MELNNRTWRSQRAAIYVAVIHILSFKPVALPEGVKIKTVVWLGMFVLIEEVKKKGPLQLLDSPDSSMLYTKDHIDGQCMLKYAWVSFSKILPEKTKAGFVV